MGEKACFLPPGPAFDPRDKTIMTKFMVVDKDFDVDEPTMNLSTSRHPNHKTKTSYGNSISHSAVSTLSY